MERIHENILVTGVPASGKTTIRNVFSNFGDKCNVIDIDLYGKSVFDKSREKRIWQVDPKDITTAILQLKDKPTIIVGICDNISDLINELDFSIIYIIDHKPEEIAERLNIRYDEADENEKLRLFTLYGVEHHDVETVTEYFTGSKQKVLSHQADVAIEEKTILDIVSDIAYLLHKTKV